MINLADSRASTRDKIDSGAASAESVLREARFSQRAYDPIRNGRMRVTSNTCAHGHDQAQLQQTLLETNFPFKELSLVISADRRAPDPIYGVHRWWARRPPALLRALLIANDLSANASLEDFWRLFGAAERPLVGQMVLDPFMGGGSTLIEAARLGAHVSGSDVDPLAVRIVRAELACPSESELRKAGTDLLNALNDALAKYYLDFFEHSKCFAILVE